MGDLFGSLFFWSTVIGLALVAVVAALPWLLRRRGVTMCRTKFGTTLIFESENADGTPVRLINVNGTFQSVCYLPDDLHFELACLYHRELADVIDRKAREAAADGRQLRVLVMGGGGYSLPKYLAAYVPAAHVEVVEVDPAMTKIAREQFFLDECLEKTDAERDGRLVLVNDDAWGYLRRQTEPYDVIVNDAFSGKRPLGPMKTDEGARVVREHLAQGGTYLANVRSACEGRRAATLCEVEAAFGHEFASWRVIPEWEDEPQKPGNNVFLAQ